MKLGIVFFENSLEGCECSSEVGVRDLADSEDFEKEGEGEKWEGFDDVLNARAREGAPIRRTRIGESSML